ncbi:MAG: FHA domain-containing protein [Lentisphaerae bacterium]|nr:FHA domain-containing protein [Lentisphaerota bacterium]
MTDSPHLEVRQGPEAGRVITIPPGGARLGRSSKNDIVIEDALLSRHHCRFYFKPGQGLWVTDLASANGTFVDGVAVQDLRVQTGAKVAVGDTVIEVISDRIASEQAAATGAAVDLGLSKSGKVAVPRRRVGKFPLFVLMGVVVLVALLAWLPKLSKPGRKPDRPAVAAAPVTDLPLSIEYEKVQATANNIFRYALTLNHAGILAIQIDDLEGDRHVRKEKRVDPALIKDLAKDIAGSGFGSLGGDYSGIQPGVFEQYDLSVTIGPGTHRVRVLNRLEPDEFKRAREAIESFGKSELILWPIQFSPEKLRQMAGEAYQLGRKHYEERDVKLENLSLAVRRLEEAEWYLETVEPKPDDYPDIVKLRSDCKQEIDRRFDDLNFRAERSIKLRDLPDAASALQNICELIPDRADTRNEEARKRLVEVQRRMYTGR